MLAYLGTKADFLRDAPVIEDKIRDVVKSELNFQLTPSMRLNLPLKRFTDRSLRTRFVEQKHLDELCPITESSLILGNEP